MGYWIGTDIGGTCTDSVVVGEDGEAVIGKDLSTYPDFSGGIFDSLADATGALAVDTVEELLSEAELFLHGTTVGENTIFERDGATVGLLTTAGFEDTLAQTRGGYGRWSGLSYEEIKRPVRTDKPEPLVPAERIVGLEERSHRADVLHPLDEADIEAGVDTLVDADVDAIACCLLWSFRSPEHEQNVSAYLAEHHPEIYASVSHEVAPSEGEYERTSTTVINSYLGPKTERYLRSLETQLRERGFDGTMGVMFSHGGLVTPEDAIEKPVGHIESGPVSGLFGSRYTADALDRDRVISTDMGGTTFKAGLVDDGRVEYADEPMVGRYHYQFPKRDVDSIPVAGGSLVTVDDSGVPAVGPESAGSDPGPVCYDRGGEQPTITDIDLLLGYFSPEFFLGGDEVVDAQAARTSVAEQIAQPLEMGPTEAAAAIYRLANSMIADFLREITVEKGIDPREFALTAIGGAAGMHAASYARELGVPEVIVPRTASVHSAFGLLSTDISYEYSTVRELSAPFDPAEIGEIFAELSEEAERTLASKGFSAEERTLERSISMRYQRQVHEVVTPFDPDTPVSEADVDAVIERYETIYEDRYGQGSAFNRDDIEMIDFRVRASGDLQSPRLTSHELTDGDPSEGLIERTEMYFEGTGETTAGYYDFEDLAAGTTLAGPAVVLTPVTSIVVNPGDRARIDRFRNVRIEIGGAQ